MSMNSHQALIILVVDTRVLGRVADSFQERRFASISPTDHKYTKASIFASKFIGIKVAHRRCCWRGCVGSCNTAVHLIGWITRNHTRISSSQDWSNKWVVIAVRHVVQNLLAIGDGSDDNWRQGDFPWSVVENSQRHPMYTFKRFSTVLQTSKYKMFNLKAWSNVYQRWVWFARFFALQADWYSQHVLVPLLEALEVSARASFEKDDMI
jgi:hypothetical protein